jgi:hypothetical protein
MPSTLLVALFLSSRFATFAPHILAWELFLSCALLGWGWLVLRALRLRDLPVAVPACTGVAIWLFLGGWLNLFRWAGKNVLLGLLAVGFLWFLRELFASETRTSIRHSLASLRGGSTGWKLAALILGIYFVAIFATQIRPMAWNKFDDTQAYMAFADKAASFKSLQSDPFSERRVNTGLGGAIYLSVTALAGADDSVMGFLDGGFGYVAFLFSLWAVLRRVGVPRRYALAALWLLPLLQLGKLNLTSVYLSAAFMLTLLLLVVEQMEARYERALPTGLLPTGLLLGLLLGAAFTLKSSNVPFGLLFLTLCALLFVFKTRRLAMLTPFLLAAGALLITAIPWMLALRRDEGTFLFPVLGLGDHSCAFGLLPVPTHASPFYQSFLISLPGALAILVAGALWWLLALDRHPTVALFFFTSAVSALTIGISVAGDQVDRFIAPFLVPCMILFAGTLFTVQYTTSPNRLRLSAAYLGLILLYSVYVVDLREGLEDDPGRILALFGNAAHLRSYDAALTASDIAADGQRVRRAQMAVPPGIPVLEATATAYGYDWHRNPIFIADYPGMAGVAPGIPIHGTGEDVRRYLLGAGIHFIVYDSSLHLPDEWADFERDPTVHLPASSLLRHPKHLRSQAAWTRMEFNVEQHTRTLFEQIAASHAPIYRDGSIEVIPLD